MRVVAGLAGAVSLWCLLMGAFQLARWLDRKVGLDLVAERVAIGAALGSVTAVGYWLGTLVLSYRF